MADDKLRESVYCSEEFADGACPVPSSHDKIFEAHHFIHQLIQTYHDPNEFRFNLSAFFQSARSTTFMIQSELTNRAGFEEWWEKQRTRMAGDADLKLLNEFRVTTFHKSSLVPGSQIFAGHFKYGRPKSGLVMAISPFTPTLPAFLHSRKIMAAREHPHRMWEGEEFGLQRTWRLKEIGDRELVEFCLECWQKLVGVLSETHRWLGQAFKLEENCKHADHDFRTLLESEMFAEVSKAWDSKPTELIEPTVETLQLYAEPDEAAEAYHSIAREHKAIGWVGGTSPLWSNNFASMLLYSIDDQVISKNTSVFLRLSDAKITSIAEEDVDSDDEA